MSSSVFPMSPPWESIIITLKRAEEWAEQASASGQLQPLQKELIAAQWRKRREDYLRSVEANAEVPDVADIMPLQSNELPIVENVRLWRFLAHEFVRLQREGKLTLNQSHALNEEACERLNSAKRQMAQEGLNVSREWVEVSKSQQNRDSSEAGATQTAGGPLSASSGSPSFEGRVVSRSRRNILEILLDPRSIQWLLGLGGTLIVVGLVILLWVNEFFTPPVMAVVMGAVNVAVLVGGWGLIRMTRYQTVGKALTLLACLVMPLNLWYYSTNSLMTLDGHLWVASVVICALYAASAWLLKDEVFVYVFCGGVAMTGLLVLADWPPSPQRFWEIASPATMLILLGLAAIHVERAFGDGEGPFSRKRFGMAFFHSGHALMAAGLMLILMAQLSGDWLYALWFKPVFDAWNAMPSPICHEQLWLALSLVLAATYAYVYSDLVVKKQGRLIHLAAFTLLWAEILGVKILNLNVQVDAIIAVLAMTSLVVNMGQSLLIRDPKLSRSLPLFGLLLGLLPVMLGLVAYFQFFGLSVSPVGHNPQHWSYVGAMVLAAVASRFGAYLHRSSPNWLPTTYHFATAASLMVASVAALAALGWEKWQQHAPVMMLIPIAYLTAAKLYRDHSLTRSLTWVAHAATGVMLVSSLSSAFQGFAPGQVGHSSLNLALALFFAEATVFYGLATAFERQPQNVHLGALMACGSLWQIMTFCGLHGAEAYILAFAMIGLGLLMVYRFSILERTAAAPLAEAAFQTANSVLSLAFVSAAMRGLRRLFQDAAGSTQLLDWGFFGFSVTLLVIAGLTVAVVKVAGWRRWYIVNVVIQAALTLVALHKLIDLTPWQQAELFSVIAGLILLAIGHAGWYREQDRESDLVSMSLFFGSLLTVVPLAIATWSDRAHGKFLILNETGFLFASVLLLVTGTVFRLKSTTLVGSISTALYFLTLLIFVPWSSLSTIATLIIIGGGLIFGTGLTLAFFRDRLLAIPERIHKREGIFMVLNWR
jgi:hypothetical protein